MAISYNIYANDGRGGDVDYNTPIATTALRTFTVNPLACPGDHTFAVRAFDTISGIEEANTDARARIVTDSSGNDVTARPNGVLGLSARLTANGTCWVSWGYNSTGQGGAPLQFNIYLTPGGSASFASPAATVAYLQGVSGYGCTLSGLASNTISTIAVQAIGASGALTGPVKSVAVSYLANSLREVDSLVAIPSA
jgi:hypothetical protein